MPLIDQGWLEARAMTEGYVASVRESVPEATARDLKLAIRNTDYIKLAP